MPRLTYDDPAAEDIFLNNTSMAKQNPDDLQKRMDTVSNAIKDGTFDPQGTNNTDYIKKIKASGN